MGAVKNYIHETIDACLDKHCLTGAVRWELFDEIFADVMGVDTGVMGDIDNLAVNADAAIIDYITTATESTGLPCKSCSMVGFHANYCPTRAKGNEVQA